MLKALQKNDEKAWAYLYETYSASISTIIKKIIQDVELVEDVIQLTYVKVWVTLKCYDSTKGNLAAWISSIARNQAIDVTRSRSYKNAKSTINLMETDEGSAALETTRMNISLIDVKDQLKILQPPEAKLVRLIYYNGYTHVEAAKALNIPLGTVKSRLRRSMVKLRKVYAYLG